MVKLKAGDQIIDFMVDTGAKMSVVTESVTPLSIKATAIEDVTREKLIRLFCLPQKCQMGGHQVTHEFLYIPECPTSLLGRDLLSKLGVQVTFYPPRKTHSPGGLNYLFILPLHNPSRLMEVK